MPLPPEGVGGYVYDEPRKLRSNSFSNGKHQGSTMKDSLQWRSLFPLALLARPEAFPLDLLHHNLRQLILLAVGALTRVVPATPEEIALVTSMGLQGSGGAEEVYRLYSQRVYRFIYWRVSEQAEDAEELTLDTFLSAITLSKGFDGRSTVFVWLCGIAKLRMIDLHRKNGRTKRESGNQRVSMQAVTETAEPPRNGGRSHAEEILDRISASQIMDSALLSLSVDECESLLLLLVDGLSVREIASHMKRSEDAIDSLTRRAKGKLRIALLDLLGEAAGND
jgi:RNA polymerase sigma factor (sigma-70 family)